MCSTCSGHPVDTGRRQVSLWVVEVCEFKLKSLLACNVCVCVMCNVCVCVCVMCVCVMCVCVCVCVWGGGGGGGICDVCVEDTR